VFDRLATLKSKLLLLRGPGRLANPSEYEKEILDAVPAMIEEFVAAL